MQQPNSFDIQISESMNRTEKSIDRKCYANCGAQKHFVIGADKKCQQHRKSPTFNSTSARAFRHFHTFMQIFHTIYGSFVMSWEIRWTGFYRLYDDLFSLDVTTKPSTLQPEGNFEHKNGSFFWHLIILTASKNKEMKVKTGKCFVLWGNILLTKQCFDTIIFEFPYKIKAQ